MNCSLGRNTICQPGDICAAATDLGHVKLRFEDSQNFINADDALDSFNGRCPDPPERRVQPIPLLIRANRVVEVQV